MPAMKPTFSLPPSHGSAKEGICLGEVRGDAKFATLGISDKTLFGTCGSLLAILRPPPPNAIDLQLGPL